MRTNAVLALAAGVCIVALAAPVQAQERPYNIPAGSLRSALDAFGRQSGKPIIYKVDEIQRLYSRGYKGKGATRTVLDAILAGTGCSARIDGSGAVAIVKTGNSVDRDSASSSGNTAASEESADQGDIIVTARRREENIQSVPIAITLVSQKTLQENNVVTLTDLRQLSPSLSGATGAISRDAFVVSIRGQRDSNGRPGVFLYLNDVPIPNDPDAGGGLAGGPGLLFDLENVQVLKGPQGTLFGRNSVGGAILLQSARPRNEFGGRLQIGYGNYDNREIDAALNVPIVADKVLARVAFNAAKRHGFTFLQADPAHPNGIDVDNRDYWSLRGSLTLRPSDRFQADIIATYQDYDSNGSPPFLFDVNPASYGGSLFPALTTYLAQQQALGIRTHIPVDTNFVSSGNFLALSATAKYELNDNLTFRTILGYDRSLSRRAFGDATPAPISAIPRDTRVRVRRQYTAEAQLLGNSFGGKLDWIIGGFYYKLPDEGLQVQTGTLLGGIPNEFRASHSEESKALFAQGNYDLSSLLPGLKATAGLRYTWDSTVDVAVPGGFGVSCTGTPFPVGCRDSDLKRTPSQSEALTWTLGMEYRASPDTLLYLASRKGYRAGGAENTAAIGLHQYDPEFVTDYEFGIKSDWTVAGRPIRTNAAIFYQDYSNIQVQRTLPNSVNGITDNAAGARLWGAELEARFKLTDHFELGGHASYLNIRYTKFAPGVSASTIADIKARELQTPAWQYGLNARYDLPVDPKIGNMSVQANWSWQDKFENILAVSLGTMKISSYGLLNLSANWDNVAGRPIDLSFFMSNALNKDYIVGGASVLNFLGYANATYGEPRMYGVRLKYHFGSE